MEFLPIFYPELTWSRVDPSFFLGQGMINPSSILFKLGLV